MIRGLLDAGKETKGKGKLAGTSNVSLIYAVDSLDSPLTKGTNAGLLRSEIRHCSYRYDCPWYVPFPPCTSYFTDMYNRMDHGNCSDGRVRTLQHPSNETLGRCTPSSVPSFLPTDAEFNRASHLESFPSP